MSVGVQIDIRDQASAVLAAQKAEMAPERLALVAGRGAQNKIRTHLLGLNRTHPNKLGGKRTEFYRRAANSLSTVARGGSAIVSIHQIGFAQRLFGGTIRPRTAKFLAIPVHPAAHGRRPREFGDRLKVVFGAGGRPVGLATKPGSINGVGEWMYVFRRSVTQPGDATLLPAAAQIAAAASSAISSSLGRARRRASIAAASGTTSSPPS